MAVKEEEKKLYEGMYIITSALSEEARAKALEKIQFGITELGGEIHKVHIQGRRRLAYEVNRQREGHYFLIYFSTQASAIKEMWATYHLNEDLIRFMTKRTGSVMEEIKFKSLEQA